MFPSGLPEEVNAALLQVRMKWTEKQLLEENTVIGLRYLSLAMEAQQSAEEQETRHAQTVAKTRH